MKTFNATIDASGQAASATPTANSTIGGPYNVTAAGNGISSAATFSLTNTKVPTTTTVASSVNPSNAGQSVTFTATVTGTQAGTLTGTVTFKDNGSAIPTCTNVPLSSGQAACTTSNLSVGNHTIAAEYSGDATFDVSSNTLAGGQQVNPSVSIGDVSLAEGDSGAKSFNFPVTLSSASNLTVKVDYQTSNGTATAGTDYVAAGGTLTFNPGETQKNAAVTVNGDTLNEPDETFFVTISNPVNAAVATAKATGTIKNDDAQPSLSIGNISVAEGNSGTTNATFTITLSAQSGEVVTVNYATADGTATAGTDYFAASGVLTFNPGETTKTVPVVINGDTLNEPDETFFVNLSNPSNATVAVAQGTGTIKNDDGPPSLSVSDVTLAEGNSGTTAFNFTVTLLPQSGQVVTVNYATADGTATVANNDYKAASGTLTFNPGETTKTVTVLVNGDTVNEPDETFFVNLSNAQNASVSKAQGTGKISNDDTPVLQFSASSSSVGEGAGRVTINVTRTGDASVPVSVNFATVDDQSPIRCDDTTTKPGVAFARCDYATTITTISFAPGETAKPVNVPIIDDSFVEPTETFQVALSKPAGGASLGSTSTATVSITDNDAAGETNPIFNAAFFVRQQYLDLLSREPESDGFNAWVNTLSNCPNPFNTDPNSPSAQCDRIHVSAAFFLSREFQLKGFFVFKFYKVAFGRLPHYDEITADMSSVTGATTEELVAKKAAFTSAFAQRPDFASAYGSLTDAQFVAALMDRYNLQSITTPDPANPDGQTKVTLSRGDLVSRLTAGTLTRAQVLRAVSDSDQVSAAEFNSAFVAMQYFGYLRRDPEQQGYDNWLKAINANPADVRSMISGFINSVEYRLRFGQP
ncbi:MAG: Ig-like domain repeat protein [Acidobacteriota bacterium]|nr:Ig-like domain repeat protein [Acidobacteriota bacterium]